MRRSRRAFAAAALAFAAAAFACALVWHFNAFVPMIGFVALLCVLSLFERGRYRAARAPAGTNWQPTGERFFDPVSGAPTEVFCEPITGAREYRVS